ncbi:unnamed protein product [Penicillium salamii]|uniref:Hydrophobin n=1 Tax=Penicillium salamii TaxID=1612424 RepID=A0A9W4JWG0_9EURO|nr:unnamed protein product [Penicillium salamii]CAG8105393.1 unnamed protein product [Penicillium salamii]CAG8384364.1 unnamed protein product [Penicillium salamii]CAG8397465.1 unnamed protein product [Penicillium salamii]CAG8406612.1 unnamed protein product [Penicillium salamii]
MKFIGTIAFSLTVAVAMGAKLTDSAAFDHAKSQCDVGDISCCNSEEDTKADGILGNLLAGGLLNGVLGNSNSPCAKTSLIDELNILASIKNTDSGPVCKNIIACCPEGTTTVSFNDYLHSMRQCLTI